jgi:hypothetical protein
MKRIRWLSLLLVVALLFSFAATSMAFDPPSPKESGHTWGGENEEPAMASIPAVNTWEVAFISALYTLGT